MPRYVREAMTLARSEPRPPVLDGRFLLLERLGSGGMGSVFRAFDAAARREVAVKIVEGGGGAGPAHPLSIEFETWARLRHPNVVRALDLGRARAGPFPAGRPYLVLEFFPGRPAHLALAPGRVEPGAVLAVARGLLRALDHVHGSGLVHRDVKPGNALVSLAPGRAPRIKLTDFGLAVEAGHREPPGAFSGSVPYLSPEALLGLPLDARADLYGLGLLLHLLALGRLPFDGANAAEAVRWHLAGPRPAPEALRSATGGRLASLVSRLLARDRSERPSTAAEAARLLDPGTGRLASPAPAPGRAERAALRLALDAARLGARRRFDLPAPRRPAARLVEEATVLARVHGLAVLRIGGRGEESLARAVLRLLLESGEEAGALIERHRLQRALPLRVVGGVPVWDRERDGAAPEGPVAGAVARAVLGLLLDVASRRGLLAALEPASRSSAVECETARLLAASADAGTGPQPGRGGLLVIDGRAAPRARRGTGPSPRVRDPRAGIRARAAYEHPLVAPQLTQT